MRYDDPFVIAITIMFIVFAIASFLVICTFAK
jgi:hypothetical protein